MRTLTLSLVLAATVVAPAIAREPVPSTTSDAIACIFPLCGGLQDALLDSLADEGLVDVHGLAYSEDEKGRGWLTVVSTHAHGIPHIGSATSKAIEGTRSYVLTVPIALHGFDRIQAPGGTAAQVDYFLEIAGIDGDSGSGGGGGSSCEEVCVCTEDGYECWLEC